ncbi:GxxExxY protein [Candidatus Wolfebacteria bacterium]|nr:GxxExxY protein [Candidatus Wolfebacteria bacterium]
MRTDTNTANNNKEIIYKELSYELGGIFYKVHDELGRYAREKQYGDLLEKFFNEKGIKFEREKIISKTGNDINKADFIVNNSIIIELKVKPIITTEDYYQVKRYLEFTNLRLGMVVNFRQKYLKPKRIINSNYKIN